MARLTREESRARTRELLFASALKCVAENGYDGVTVTDIAESAGFSKGAFFANFESKESMLFELLRRNFENERAMQVQVAASARRGESMVEKLDDYFGMLEANLDYIRYNMQMLLYANRTPSFAPSYFALYDEYRVMLAGMMGVVFNQLGLQPVFPLQEITDQLIAMAHGLVLQRRESVTEPLKYMLNVFLQASKPVM